MIDEGELDSCRSPWCYRGYAVGIVNNRRDINQSPIRVFIALLNGDSWCLALVLRFDTENRAGNGRQGGGRGVKGNGGWNQPGGFREGAFVSHAENTPGMV